MATIGELAKQGISRIRLPFWKLPEDYVRIDLVEGGMHGPWGHLYSPLNEIMGEKNPRDFLLVSDSSSEWEPYEGEAAPEDEPAATEKDKNEQPDQS